MSTGDLSPEAEIYTTPALDAEGNHYYPDEGWGISYVEAKDIGPQLYVGPRRPDIQFFNVPQNAEGCWVKPQGGLWTSSYHVEKGSYWVEWCRGESFRIPEEGKWQSWLLMPRPDAPIAIIDSIYDLQTILRAYTCAVGGGGWGGSGTIDFEKMAMQFSAIHLTDRGQEATRNTIPNLYGWDMESTLWLDWAFSDVQDLGVCPWGGSLWDENDDDY